MLNDWSRDVLDAVQDGVVVADVEQRIVYANPAARRWCHAAPNDELKHFVSALAARLSDGSACPTDQLPLVRALLGSTVDPMTLQLGPPAAPVTILASARPVRDKFGTVTSAVMTLQDVTGTARVAGDLEKVNSFLDSIVENIPHMVFVKHAETRAFELMNRAGEELLGLSREQMIGRTDHDFFPKEQADFFHDRDTKTLTDGRVVDISEEPIETAAGRRWLHTKKIPIVLRDGRPEFLLGISMDITELKLAREELERANHELDRRVRERTAELASANTKLIQINEELALANLGLEREASERLRAETALSETEEALRQSQKMEAIGRLAGGVAHDFNNLLSVILGHSEMLATDLRSDPRTSEHVDQIREAGQRAARLTHQLLAFSRRQVMKPTLIRLNDVVLEMQKMLRRLISEDIELEVRLDPALHAALLDPSQMEQVIMNLAVNARDAMPAGGKLLIYTENVDFDLRPPRRSEVLLTGPHVLLAVADTGSGMDAEMLTRVFEPFYTTKSRGRGTGLGLSTIYGIVKQSGGHIEVSSEPGRGTTFSVYFPRAPEGSMSRQATRAVPPVIGGSETLLIVEDEAAVRSTMASIFSRAGYRVLEAATAEAALAIVRVEGHRIDLMIADVVMPHQSGPELVSTILGIVPGLRVLYTSGYTEDRFVHQAVSEDSIAFLPKPVTPDMLLAKVRETLDHPPKQSALHAIRQDLLPGPANRSG